MTREIDYHDVEGMIRDARYEMSRDIRNAVEELRADVNAIADELRKELAGLGRTLASRTDHLA